MNECECGYRRHFGIEVLSSWTGEDEAALQAWFEFVGVKGFVFEDEAEYDYLYRAAFCREVMDKAHALRRLKSIQAQVQSLFAKVGAPFVYDDCLKK